jgi:hypothetical protein
MKQRKHLLLLLGLLIMGYQQLLAEQNAQLVNLRYYDHGGSSRLAIRLQGNPQYSAVRNESDVRIILQHTGAPVSYDVARMDFTSGFVAHVHIDRRRGDSVVVIVGLRTNTAFRIERMGKVDGLFVDVFPDSSHTLAQDTVSADTALAIGHPSVIMPIQTMSFNTLVAAGDVPSKEQKDTIVRAGVPTVAAAIPNTSLIWPKAHVLHVSLAIALAVLGTALVLLFIRRLYTTRSLPVPSTFTTGFTEAISKQGHERREVPREMLKHGVVEPPRDRLLDAESSALMLAKRYGRGLGEVKLSFDLRSRQSERRWIKRVQEFAEKNEDKQDRIAVAKELGIGRGEVDLAVLLHHLKTPKTLKEELV